MNKFYKFTNKKEEDIIRLKIYIPNMALKQY